MSIAHCIEVASMRLVWIVYLCGVVMCVCVLITSTQKLWKALFTCFQLKFGEYSVTLLLKWLLNIQFRETLFWATPGPPPPVFVVMSIVFCWPRLFSREQHPTPLINASLGPVLAASMRWLAHLTSVFRHNSPHSKHPPPAKKKGTV